MAEKKHSTLNIQLPTTNGSNMHSLRRSALNVECSTFPHFTR
jgi:hypothetical protein